MDKRKPKFEIGNIVKADTIAGRMQVVDYWWSDDTYGSKSGDYVYRLRFVNKEDKIDNRKNARRFEESRLAVA